jgi:hypothetical protein
MATETIAGIGIQAPLRITIRDNDERLKALVLKTLEFLFNKVINQDFSFLLGGKRSFGYGNAVLVFVNRSGNYLTRARNCLGINEEDCDKIDQLFDELVSEQKEKYPIVLKEIEKKDKD